MIAKRLISRDEEIIWARRKAKEIHCCFSARSTCYLKIETYTPCLFNKLLWTTKNGQTSQGSKNSKREKPIFDTIDAERDISKKQEQDCLKAISVSSLLWHQVHQNVIVQRRETEKLDKAGSRSRSRPVLRCPTFGASFQYIEDKVRNKAKLWAIIGSKAAETMLTKLTSSVFTGSNRLRHKVSIVVDQTSFLGCKPFEMLLCPANHWMYLRLRFF